MTSHIQSHELSLSQMLVDVCIMYHEKYSVVTHTCIGPLTDVSNNHSTQMFNK